MDKKRKNILVWALAWAGLLVAVLYSPVGSPGMYVSTRNVVYRQGSAFDGVRISDVPALKATVTNTSGAMGSQAYSGGTNSQNAYSVSENAFDSKPNSGNLAGLGRYSVSGNQNEREKTGGIAGSSVMLFAAAKGRGSNNNAVAQNTGVVSINTDMTMLDNYSNNKQSVGPGGDGGADPGGDPTGPVIPVGDGWVFLMILVSGYSAWKMLKR
ncbi:MAG: hypothetical protein QM800_07225 [Paludibacter sp.]